MSDYIIVKDNKGTSHWMLNDLPECAIIVNYAFGQKVSFELWYDRKYDRFIKLNSYTKQIPGYKYMIFKGDPCKSASLWNNGKGRNYTRNELINYLRNELYKRDKYIIECKKKYFN